MKNYKWYLFDLDNTILDFSTASKNAFRETLTACGIANTASFYSVYSKINHFYWQQYEQGKINADVLRKGRFKDFLNEINYDFDPVKMSAIYLDFLIFKSEEISGSIDVLKKLSKYANLALVTNGLSDVQHKRIEKHDLKQYFKHIFISDEMGVSKPAHSFFDRVHKTIKKPNKTEVLVLGDNPKSDILGANNFGYHSLFYNYLQNESSDIKANFKINSWKEFK